MDPIRKRKVDESDDGAAVITEGDVSTSQLLPDDAGKLLERLSKEELVEILKNAISRHNELLVAARSVADRDVTKRKLFIRGLGADTTTDSLRDVFSSYSEIEEAIVILDKNTGRSKGYGFVTFKHVDGAIVALKDPSKIIDGRVSVAQLAADGKQGNNSNSADVSMRKIFVADVPFDMPPEKLVSHFSQYGEIEEGPLGFDKATGKSKGFALFVYKTVEGAQACLMEPVKIIDGRQLNCKLAIEGKKNPGQAGPMGPGGVHFPGLGHGGSVQFPGSSMPGSMVAQYGGVGAYGGLPGGLQGSSQSSYGGPGLASVGSQAASSAVGSGGYGFSGHHVGYGGPGSAAYGGSSGAAVGRLNGSDSGFGTGSGYKLPPGPGGMTSGGYLDGTSYGSVYPNQLNQPTGASPVPRVPPGGAYPNMPPYYRGL